MNNNLQVILKEEGISKNELLRACQISATTIVQIANNKYNGSRFTQIKILKGLNEILKGKKIYKFDEVFPDEIVINDTNKKKKRKPKNTISDTIATLSLYEMIRQALKNQKTISADVLNELQSDSTNKEKAGRIFLCHASEDKEIVLKVYHKLKNIGFNPWLDKYDIIPGQLWDIEIQKSLKESKCIIIFISQNSVNKRGYVQKEMKLALETLKEIPEGQIFIIPIKLDNSKVPDSLNHIHYTTLNSEEDFANLIKSLLYVMGIGFK